LTTSPAVLARKTTPQKYSGSEKAQTGTWCSYPHLRLLNSDRQWMLGNMSSLPSKEEFETLRVALSGKGGKVADRELVAKAWASLERSYANLRGEGTHGLTRHISPETCREIAKDCRRIAALPKTSPRKASTLKALANNLSAVAGQIERLQSIVRDELEQRQC
jgi:hypothetical protein